jgi:hypothetical protein
MIRLPAESFETLNRGAVVTSLKERLGQNPQRKAVVTDACQVLDQEVADKSGLGGIAIKGAYSIVKGIKPGFVEEVVDGLLDDFLDALDPLYREAQERKEPPGRYLAANGERAADALLAITDARAARSSRAVIQKTYDKLRPTAKKHVASAAPRLGQMLDRHVS